MGAIEDLVYGHSHESRLRDCGLTRALRGVCPEVYHPPLGFLCARTAAPRMCTWQKYCEEVSHDSILTRHSRANSEYASDSTANLVRHIGEPSHSRWHGREYCLGPNNKGRDNRIQWGW